LGPRRVVLCAQNFFCSRKNAVFGLQLVQLEMRYNPMAKAGYEKQNKTSHQWPSTSNTHILLLGLVVIALNAQLCHKLFEFICPDCCLACRLLGRKGVALG
jgi:hypothetical protein